jgi:hypothetical protein
MTVQQNTYSIQCFSQLISFGVQKSLLSVTISIVLGHCPTSRTSAMRSLVSIKRTLLCCFLDNMSNSPRTKPAELQAIQVTCPPPARPTILSSPGQETILHNTDTTGHNTIKLLPIDHAHAVVDQVVQKPGLEALTSGSESDSERPSAPERSQEPRHHFSAWRHANANSLRGHLPRHLWNEESSGSRATWPPASKRKKEGGDKRWSSGSSVGTSEEEMTRGEDLKRTRDQAVVLEEQVSRTESLGSAASTTEILHKIAEVAGGGLTGKTNFAVEEKGVKAVELIVVRVDGDAALAGGGHAAHCSDSSKQPSLTDGLSMRHLSDSSTAKNARKGYGRQEATPVESEHQEAQPDTEELVETWLLAQQLMVEEIPSESIVEELDGSTAREQSDPPTEEVSSDCSRVSPSSSDLAMLLDVSYHVASTMFDKQEDGDQNSNTAAERPARRMSSTSANDRFWTPASRRYPSAATSPPDKPVTMERGIASEGQAALQKTNT